MLYCEEEEEEERRGGLLLLLSSSSCCCLEFRFGGVGYEMKPPYVFLQLILIDLKP